MPIKIAELEARMKSSEVFEKAAARCFRREIDPRLLSVVNDLSVELQKSLAECHKDALIHWIEMKTGEPIECVLEKREIAV